MTSFIQYTVHNNDKILKYAELKSYTEPQEHCKNVYPYIK